MTEPEARTKLMLSIQRALLGEVTGRMQSVTCGIQDREIKIRAYFLDFVGEHDIVRMQRVGAEVIADFPDGYQISESCVCLVDEEERMLDFWAFSRATE